MTEFLYNFFKLFTLDNIMLIFIIYFLLKRNFDVLKFLSTTGKNVFNIIEKFNDYLKELHIKSIELSNKHDNAYKDYQVFHKSFVDTYDSYRKDTIEKTDSYSLKKLLVMVMIKKLKER